MAVLLERRSGKDRRRCTLPALMALGWERRWHLEQRRSDSRLDEADGLDDEFFDVAWRDPHDSDDRLALAGDG